MSAYIANLFKNRLLSQCQINTLKMSLRFMEDSRFESLHFLENSKKKKKNYKVTDFVLMMLVGDYVRSARDCN